MELGLWQQQRWLRVLRASRTLTRSRGARLAQFVLGSLLVAAAVAKVFTSSVPLALPGVSDFASPAVATIVSASVAAIEFAVGGLLVAGRAVRPAAVGALVLAVLFSLYHMGCSVFGCGQPSCGCFGDALRAGQAAAAFVAGVLLLLSWYVLVSLRT